MTAFLPAQPVPAQTAPALPDAPRTGLRTVTIGLLGCGTVGQAVLQLLKRREAIFADLGVQLSVCGVLVRDLKSPRDVPAGTPLTGDPAFLGECSMVVELMGGVERPLGLLAPVLRSRRPVVTANKAMLAERWDTLREYALGGQLYYESAVMAGTPIIGPMSTVLRASRFVRLQAVLNGTCAYILGQMETRQALRPGALGGAGPGLRRDAAHPGRRRLRHRPQTGGAGPLLRRRRLPL